MIYFAQSLPQNAPSQSPSTLNPQSGEGAVNQQLTPQNSTSTFSLGSERSSTSFLNSTSTSGIELSGVSSQTLTAELDSAPTSSTPPFAGVGLVVLIVVALVIIARKTYQ